MGFQPDDASTAIHDIGSLGYEGYETFGEYLDAWELKGGLKPVLDGGAALISRTACDLTDPTKRAAEVAKIVRWAKLIRSAAAVTAVSVRTECADRPTISKRASQDIVAALNEISRAVVRRGHHRRSAPAHRHLHRVSRRGLRGLEAVDTKVVSSGRMWGSLQRRFRSGEVVKDSCH